MVVLECSLHSFVQSWEMWPLITLHPFMPKNMLATNARFNHPSRERADWEITKLKLPAFLWIKDVPAFSKVHLKVAAFTSFEKLYIQSSGPPAQHSESGHAEKVYHLVLVKKKKRKCS